MEGGVFSVFLWLLTACHVLYLTQYVPLKVAMHTCLCKPARMIQAVSVIICMYRHSHTEGLCRLQ